MPAKTNINTKDARAAASRPLQEIKEEISEHLEALEDMRFNLREAGKAIKNEGVLIAVITRSNDNKEVRTKKLNPACKLQRDMLGAIKSLKKSLESLRVEEQTAATRLAAPKDEFEGL